MPKNYKLKESIMNVLKKGEMSRGNLLKNVRDALENRVSERTFNEALMTLLKDNAVEISGYDFSIYKGVKRVQSIKMDGLIFNLVTEDDPIKTISSVKKLGSNDCEKIGEAYKDLKRMFKKRMYEINTNEITKCTHLKETLDFQKLPEIINQEKPEELLRMHRYMQKILFTNKPLKSSKIQKWKQYFNLQNINQIKMFYSSYIKDEYFNTDEFLQDLGYSTGLNTINYNVLFLEIIKFLNITSPKTKDKILYNLKIFFCYNNQKSKDSIKNILKYMDSMLEF